MNDHATAMVMASFAADSLALGAHWIYDTNEIDNRIGRVENLLPPSSNGYHPNRQQGDFTHYGDQTLLLLESLVQHSGFSLSGFADGWLKTMRNYDGYMDKASKTTLENLQAGQSPAESGAPSSDLGGAARIAPLIYYYQDDLETLLKAARAQTTMTHAAAATADGAEFLAKTTFKVLHGATPAAAIEENLDEGVSDMDLDIRLRSSLDSVRKNSREVIGRLGQMCGIAAALPGVVHLVLSYENDLETALIENVMAGGDSAARGLATGMILGAHLGIEAIPSEWLEGLRKRDQIVNLLKKLPAP
jgi:ADP-ribosylglycohydrolase